LTFSSLIVSSDPGRIMLGHPQPDQVEPIGPQRLTFLAAQRGSVAHGNRIIVVDERADVRVGAASPVTL